MANQTSFFTVHSGVADDGLAFAPDSRTQPQFSVDRPSMDNEQHTHTHSLTHSHTQTQEEEKKKKRKKEEKENGKSTHHPYHKEDCQESAQIHMLMLPVAIHGSTAAVVLASARNAWLLPRIRMLCSSSAPAVQVPTLVRVGPSPWVSPKPAVTVAHPASLPAGASLVSLPATAAGSSAGDSGTAAAAAPSHFAVVYLAGHQFKVAEGDVIVSEKVEGEVGSQIRIADVLLLGSKEQTVIGRPLIDGASVLATIEEQTLNAKDIIFKKKRRKTYERKTGHRQPITVLRVDKVVLPAS